MSTKHLLDPELSPLLDMPAMTFTDAGMPKLRELLKVREVVGDAERHKVTRSEVTVTSGDGTELPCLLYTPPGDTSPRPGYLHIHGGGYILGSPLQADIMNLQVCAKIGAVVLSVGYRLAPEHPIPAPLDDCYAGLAWLHTQADELGIDTNRIAIGGESAGGGLAAALAIKARDAGEYAICHQHLTYPMLDNLTGSEDHPGDPLVGEFIWTRESNAYGWRSYLGDAPAVAPQVPARVEDYSGLPPAWIFTAGLDLFRDENIAYAQNLLKAGVAAELLLYPSACHGFQQVPGTQLGARFAADHLDALRRALT
ncbi:MAG: alpha/beta hydrolase [Pseudomonadota bacterium]